MLKILQASFQQNMNQQLPDVQARFRKGRITRDQIANTHWIIEKARKFQKNIYFSFIDYLKAFDYGWPQTVENSSRDEYARPPYLPPEKPQVKKQQLEPDMEQQTGSKFGKGVRQGCILSPPYLAYILTTSPSVESCGCGSGPSPVRLG